MSPSTVDRPGRLTSARTTTKATTIAMTSATTPRAGPSVAVDPSRSCTSGRSPPMIAAGGCRSDPTEAAQELEHQEEDHPDQGSRQDEECGGGQDECSDDRRLRLAWHRPTGHPGSARVAPRWRPDPATTPIRTPTHMRRSAPWTPALRRSADRASPMLSKPAVTYVTVAHDAAPTTHGSLVPPVAVRSTQRPAMATRPGPSAVSAIRSSSRPVVCADPRSTASPRRIPAGCMPKTDAGSSTT